MKAHQHVTNPTALKKLSAENISPQVMKPSTITEYSVFHITGLGWNFVFCVVNVSLHTHTYIYIYTYVYIQCTGLLCNPM